MANRRGRGIALMCALLAVLVGSVAAAEPTAKQNAATQEPNAKLVSGKVTCPTEEELASVAITDASGWKADRQTTEVRLREDLAVGVSNLRFLRAQGRCTAPERKIVLFLDGRPITNLYPDPPTDPKSSTLIFPLRRDEQSRDVWTNILGYPKWGAREVDVSVGLEGQHALPSSAKIKFAVIPHNWFGLWTAVFLFLLVLFVWIARGSDVLRLSGADPVLDSANGPVPARKMYSLSRVQAAWWFFLILASYLFIGLITGDYATTITGTVLVLAGISAGTTLGSVVIDANEQAAAIRAGTRPVVSATTGSWLKDILSDANGVSFHRFQMMVWTLVLGLVFVLTVYRELAMPVFSETLLSLLGISAGTYLGMKIPEAK